MKTFNERWFQAWEATQDDQRAKLINLAHKMRSHPDFGEKYQDNPDVQNRDIAFNKMFDDVMGAHRKLELDLYKLIAKDESFKQAMQDTLKRILRER